MNLPNKLTILRACMIPVFVVLALQTPVWRRSPPPRSLRWRVLPTIWTATSPASTASSPTSGKFMDPIADNCW